MDFNQQYAIQNRPISAAIVRMVIAVAFACVGIIAWLSFVRYHYQGPFHWMHGLIALAVALICGQLAMIGADPLNRVRWRRFRLPALIGASVMHFLNTLLFDFQDYLFETPKPLALKLAVQVGLPLAAAFAAGFIAIAACDPDDKSALIKAQGA